MRTVKWIFWGLVVLIVGLFLNYNLPQHDIVRITEAKNQQIPLGAINKYFYASQDSGTTATAVRDVRLIQAFYPNGKSIVFRNEDTGFWPPYLKFDSSDLDNKALDYKSTADAPKWVMVTHYGWRISWESIYPNAVRIVPVAGPDVRIIPWVNIVILILFAGLIFLIRRMWLQFWERMVDPAVASVEEAGDRAKGFFGRLFGRR